MKIAGAPISWGVCEVPDWGYQMSPDRVLTEMQEIGLTATEFGPQGWLPVDAVERAEVVGRYGLKPVGAFFLAVMHDPGFDPIPQVNKELDAFEAAGGEFLVLAADSGRDGYDDRPVLDEEGWQTLFANLSRITEVCAARGVTAKLKLDGDHLELRTIDPEVIGEGHKSTTELLAAFKKHKDDPKLFQDPQKFRRVK